MVYLERDDDGTTRITGYSEPQQLKAWPVGSIFMTMDNSDPKDLLGGGTWARFAAGRMPIGFSDGDTDFNETNKTGGAKTVTLDSSQIPAHKHGFSGISDFGGAHTHSSGSLSTDYSGNHSHNIPRKAGNASGTGVARGDATAAPDDTTGSGGTHSHSITGNTGQDFGHNHSFSGTSDSTGGGQPHDNMPPYVVVNMWRRTA